jgi:hypothetical protein
MVGANCAAKSSRKEDGVACWDRHELRSVPALSKEANAKMHGKQMQRCKDFGMETIMKIIVIG